MARRAAVLASVPTEDAVVTGHTQATLDAVAVAVEINGRPRKRHAWKTPAEMLDLVLSHAA